MKILIIKEGESLLNSAVQTASIVIRLNEDGSADVLKDRLGETEIIISSKVYKLINTNIIDIKNETAN